ncbi:MAG TPA: hypothetical protein VEI02_03175 [Planctomycetota bacterium]|nr:hypothetical protein [Planctomycetota bacterium]
MSAEEWEKKAPGPADACVVCGSKLATGAAYVARLVMRDGALVREDLCEGCAAAAAASDAFSAWRGRRAAPRGPAARRLDFETLVELFPRLDGREDEASRRLKWVVGLLLLRKKLLQQLSRETADGVETLTVRLRHDDRVFTLVDPKMDEAQTAALNDDLARLFDLVPTRAAK